MSAPLVTIKQGTLRGTVFDNLEGGQYFSFLGIPYAQPPIGELRFKDPQPPLCWDGIRDALKEGHISAQFNIQTKTDIGDEDCLFVNVSTNSLSGKRPVIVFLHGGRFRIHSGNRDLCVPDYLLKHDIVFVSLNYRLGILGFLNMGVEICSGNQGFKDQVYALKWIQENIEAFGGDKDNVTIFGLSSGGVSVEYLCMSPLAKGLFHKAIIQSGNLDHNLTYRESNQDIGFKLAATLGKTTSDAQEAVEFLQSIPLPEIMSTMRQVKNNFDDMQNFFLYGPTLDSKSSNPFLPIPLPEMAKNGIDVPLIIGFVSHEGMRFLKGDWCKNINENFANHLASYVGPEKIKIPGFLDSVKQFYFGVEPISIEQAENFIRYTGDLHYANPTQMCINKQIKKTTPTFVYFYSYDQEISLFNLYYPHINSQGIRGASHSDEWSVIVRPLRLEMIYPLKKYAKDHLMMQRFTKMWTDFAKTGNPTPIVDDLITEKWHPITSNKKYYLEIGEELKRGENIEGKSWTFWKSWNVYNC